MSNKLMQALTAVALLVGFVVIAAWGFRELSDFFNSLLYWMRYNLNSMAAGVIVIAIIGYFLAKK